MQFSKHDMYLLQNTLCLFLKKGTIMMNKIIASVLVLFCTNAYAEHGVSVPLANDYVAVISQGDLESASIGTYSVAIFKDKTLQDFITGAIFTRDGSIFKDNGAPRVELVDVTGDGKNEIIVTSLTAGSGNYVQVDALGFNESTKEIKLVKRIQSDTKKNNIKLLKKEILKPKI